MVIMVRKIKKIVALHPLSVFLVISMKNLMLWGFKDPKFVVMFWFISTDTQAPFFTYPV